MILLSEHCTLTDMQLERKSQERIDEKWKALEKRAKKEARKGGEGFVPPQKRPEATFVASLIDGFVKASLMNYRSSISGAYAE